MARAKKVVELRRRNLAAEEAAALSRAHATRAACEALGPEPDDEVPLEVPPEADEFAAVPAYLDPPPASEVEPVETRAVSPARHPPSSPSEIVTSWIDAGPLERIATGIAPLDELCRGGLPLPWRVLIVGAPSAGKTALGMLIARGLVDAGLCVGILAVDEEPDDLTVRLAQIQGYTLTEAEARDPDTLRRMAHDLAELRVRLYDGSHTIESAAGDIATWAKAEGRRAAIVLDSLHAVRSEASSAAVTARAYVEANVAAMRTVTDRHHMLALATVEANRASYTRPDAAEQGNDMAAGAESRAIEFAAQTQLMLRTPKGHPDVIHVRVSKNRRMARGDFWLELDREHHAVRQREEPGSCPEELAERESGERRQRKAGVARDATELMHIVARQPGIGARVLRAAVRAAGLKMGEVRLAAALQLAQEGVEGSRLVDRRPVDAAKTAQSSWYVEAIGGGE